MGCLSYTPSASIGWQPPFVECYIGGRLRTDVIVESITQRAGWFPGAARLRWDNYRYPRNPIAEGAEVIIYANRWAFPNPFFVGTVANYGLAHQSGDLVTAEAVDERARLEDDSCPCNYNYLRAGTHVRAEHLTAREIARDIHGRYLTWQSDQGRSGTLAVDSGMFPTTTMPPQRLFGMPHGSALGMLFKSVNPARKDRLRCEYRSGGNARLSTFQIGSGPVKWVTYSSEPSLQRHLQPAGYPTASRIAIRSGEESVVSHVYAEGGQSKEQVTLTLTPAWDASIGAAMAQYWERKQWDEIWGMHNVANVNFSPEAECVARRWEIPWVTETNPRSGESESIRPHILNESLDDAAHTANDVLNRPYCLVTWATVGEFPGGTRVVRDGFSIQDGQYVMFSKPRFRWSLAAGEGGAVTIEVPVSVKLVCTVLRQARDYKQEVSPNWPYWVQRRRRVREDSIRKEYWGAGTNYLTAANALSTKATAETKTDIQTELEQIAKNHLRENEKKDFSTIIEIPTCALHFNIGDRVSLNGEILADQNIMAIEYAFGNGTSESDFVTILYMGDGW